MKIVRVVADTDGYVAVYVDGFLYKHDECFYASLLPSDEIVRLYAYELTHEATRKIVADLTCGAFPERFTYFTEGDFDD